MHRSKVARDVMTAARTDKADRSEREGVVCFTEVETSAQAVLSKLSGNSHNGVNTQAICDFQAFADRLQWDFQVPGGEGHERWPATVPGRGFAESAVTTHNKSHNFNVILGLKYAYLFPGVGTPSLHSRCLVPGRLCVLT